MSKTTRDKQVYALILCIMTLTASLCGQEYGWVKITGGTEIKEIFFQNNILYARTNHKVYYSTNQGSFWQLLEDFYPDWIRGFDIDNQGTIYCYFATPDLITHGDIHNGFVTPHECSGLNTNGNHLIVLQDLLFLSCGGKVYKSDNLGASWTLTSDGLPTQGTYSYQSERIYQLYTNGARLFAGTNYNGLYYSDNYGKTWYPMNYGIPMDTYTRVVFIFSNNMRVFISTSKGIFYSDNSGYTWSRIDLSIIDFDPPIYLYNQNLLCLDKSANPVKIFISQNNGDTWYNFDTNLTFRTYITDQVITADSNNFYLANGPSLGGGVTRLDLSDTTFYPSSYGLTHNEAIYLYKLDSCLYSATSNGGIYISDNLGHSFRYSEKYLMGSVVNSMISNDSALFAATDDGIKYSLDMGNNWEVSDTSSYAKQSGNLIQFRGDIYCTMKGTVYRLADESNAWNQITMETAIPKINYLYSTIDKLYACTVEGVYYLDTISKDWTQLDSYPGTDISSMAVNDQDVYLGSRNIIYQSLDSGANWTAHTLDDESEINYLTFIQDEILAATRKGLYHFFNFEWQIQFAYRSEVNHLLVDDSTTYAATIRGVFKTQNRDLMKIIQHVKEPDHEHIRVYPNPTSDFIFIDYPDDFNYTVYSLSGELLLNSDQKKVDMSKLPPSIYIITIRDKYLNPISVNKIIKN